MDLSESHPRIRMARDLNADSSEQDKKQVPQRAIFSFLVKVSSPCKPKRRYQEHDIA
jgi:hypothetical protein